MWIEIGLLLALLYIAWLWGMFDSTSMSSRRPPLRRGLVPWLGIAMSYAGDPCAYLLKARRELGEVFRLKMLGQDMLYVCDGYVYPKLMSDPRLHFDINELTPLVMPVKPLPATLAKKYAEGTNNTTKELMKLSRMDEDLWPIFIRELDECLDAIDEGQVDLLPLVQHATMQAITSGLFGPVAGHTPNLVEKVMEFDSKMGLMATGVPQMFFPKAVAAFRKVGALTQVDPLEDQYYTISERRKFMASLGFTQDMVSDWNAGFLWVATSNVFLAAAWAAAHLINLDEADRAKIAAEVKSLKDLSRESLKGAVLLDSLLQETLRHYAAMTAIRTARDDVTFETSDGRQWDILKGEQIMMPYYLFHMDPDVHEHPDKFQFDRFVGEARHIKNDHWIQHPTAFWGGGVSKCPGRLMAMGLMKMLLIKLIRRFHIENIDPIPQVDPGRDGFGIRGIKGEMKVRLTKRPN